MRRENILYLLITLFSFSCSSNTTVQQENTPESSSATQTTTYTNPVLPGDFADPSVVRVGDDYWATATSSEWAPLFPILHSKNLVDWEIVDHVFPDKLPDWAEAHFWAPEIAYENGKYYIYYTAKKKEGNLCVGVASASSATGPYTDHGPLVCQEVGSIDGFEIRDEKGGLYLIWKEDGNSRGLPTPIWGQRMNEERTQLLGEKFELIRNEPGTWEGGLVEGPALVKRGEYFYMFYAGDKCCGRECTYGVGVARAKSLKGPWEKYEKNPIMKKSEAWMCPGHGTVVTTENGQDYFLYHAYNTNSSVYAGRQGLLDKINWGSDGWPNFEENTPNLAGKVATGTVAGKNKALDVQAEFNTNKLAATWQWPVTQQQNASINKDKGLLILKASPDKIGTVIAQRTKTADYTATTAIDKSSLQQGTTAGLTAIGDTENAMGIAFQNNEIILWSVKGGTQNNIATTAAPQQDMVYFKLTTNSGDQMRFAWSTDGNNWNTLNADKPLDAGYLPPWDRGVRIGLTAKGPATATAAFDWFRLNHKSQ